jgi:hypothetical protein
MTAGLIAALVLVATVAAATESYGYTTRTFDSCTTDVYATVVDNETGDDASYSEHRDDENTSALLVAAKAWYYKSGWFQSAWATHAEVAWALEDENNLAFGKGAWQTKVGSTWGPVWESPILDP